MWPRNLCGAAANHAASTSSSRRNRSLSEPPRSVRIDAPARLHLGFVDLCGDLGRRFGSLGLALDGYSTVVMASASGELEVSGSELARASNYARKILDALGRTHTVKLQVERAIPAHAGLGSGTQLGLAIAMALKTLFGLSHSVVELAALAHRGARSGIGIGAFETGGFIVDGGRADTSVVPPVLARYAFPHDWRVILITDSGVEGLSGRAESDAFENLPPMTAAASATLCRIALLGICPAIVERNFAAFCQHITALQRGIASYFEPVQGGVFTSTAVADVVSRVERTLSITATGQTSWGPTGFAFVDSERTARAMVEELRADLATGSSLKLSIHAARNTGARIVGPTNVDAAACA